MFSIEFMKEFSQYCKTRLWVNVFWRKIIVPFQYNLLGLASLSEATTCQYSSQALTRSHNSNRHMDQGKPKDQPRHSQDGHYLPECNLWHMYRSQTIVRVFSEAVSGANYSIGVWKAPQTPWACGGLGLYWANEINDRGAQLLVIE